MTLMARLTSQRLYGQVTPAPPVSQARPVIHVPSADCLECLWMFQNEPPHGIENIDHAIMVIDTVAHYANVSTVVYIRGYLLQRPPTPASTWAPGELQEAWGR